MVRTYWRQLQKPAFVAFHELALAARTNADLARILQPLQVEFRERFNAQAVLLFPEWQRDPEAFDARDGAVADDDGGHGDQLLTGAMDEAMVEPMLGQIWRHRSSRMKPARGPSRSGR